jgi:DNA-binding transcriptional ArsR family regulator
VIGPEEAERLAVSLKAIADSTGLRLISLVTAHADGEACVRDLTEPVGHSRPTVSHYLKILVDAGILTREQRGNGPTTESYPTPWATSPASSPPAPRSRHTIMVSPQKVRKTSHNPQ